ncbi:Argonaute siRNA chaperone complex subunit Arb1-domain-containing protein [Linnemannia elongata]|nr:Argonaute siRNA chaperone complex subunit Arb1-domain-containing protein [Linnemannia elongata]
MDPSQMTEEEARETVRKMFDEMRRTLNAEGDYNDSEDEYETNSDTEVNNTTSAVTTKDKVTAETAGKANAETTSNALPTSNNTTANLNTTEHSNNGTDDTNGEQEYDETSKISLSYTRPPTAEETTGEPEKAKKKKRKKTKKAKIELEDYLACEDGTDPLVENPYDSSKTPAERVEIAVARFRKNRKFSPIRSQILSVYLDYGGIQTGPKMFQGGGVKTGGADDDGEVDFDALNAGVDRVDLPEDGQQVDFTNVVTTFLSQFFLKSTGWIDMVYYKDTPVVVAALLNYLLVRDVLPEYKEDLQAALAVAEKAKIELPLCKMISSGWPSRYDKACSLLYGGEWYDYLEDLWQGEAAAIETIGLDRAMARKIVKSVVGPDVDIETLRAGPRDYLEMEVVHVPAIDLDEGADLDPEVPIEWQKPVNQRRKIHVFFDPNVSTKLLLGMRIAGFVYTLSNGMSYLEQAQVMPTYYLEADEVVEAEDEWED